MHESGLGGASETSQFVHNDFYKANKLILGKSAPENSDPWDLKEPVKADRDGKMMTEPSWLK